VWCGMVGTVSVAWNGAIKQNTNIFIWLPVSTHCLLWF